jgi:hypothetical protein
MRADGQEAIGSVAIQATAKEATTTADTKAKKPRRREAVRCIFQEFRACPATRKQAIGWPVEENFALRQFENNDGGFISARLTISATESLVIPHRLQ